MKEVKTILASLQSAGEKGIQTALATVVNVHGSSYRRVGARMLIQEDGYWFGSVSGGCLEGDVIEKAREVMRSGTPALYKYDTRQNAKNAFGMGYGCNGLLEILIEPIANSPSDAAFAMLRQIADNNDAQGLATVYYSEDDTVPIGSRLHSGGQGTIAIDKFRNEVRVDLLELVQQAGSISKTYRQGDKKISVFHEAVEPGITILIFGAVFHAISFLRIANELGYEVHITDSFEPVQPIWNFPDADEIKLIEKAEADRIVHQTPNLAIVFLTHNFFYIKDELPKALKSGAPYIGILGSRKKTEKILREAEVNETNYSTTELNKIHYPVGLDIGANTPEEISLSIIAEIKAFFSQRSGQPLKNFEGYIHHRHHAGG
jgi:xanthine dehydrogenase accessory factor